MTEFTAITIREHTIKRGLCVNSLISEMRAHCCTESAMLTVRKHAETCTHLQHLYFKVPMYTQKLLGDTLKFIPDKLLKRIEVFQLVFSNMSEGNIYTECSREFTCFCSNSVEQKKKKRNS